MKYTFKISACIIAIASSLHGATTLNFNNLNSDLTSGNSLDVGGLTTGLSVTGAASGNNFVYSATYTGADYDGDLTNDTLTFSVLVEGWTDGSITFGSTNNNSDSQATIGTTSTQVIITAADNTWNPVTTQRFDSGQSLQFSLTSFNVSLSGGGLASAVSTGFTQVLIDENAGIGHAAIFGEGSNLDGNTFNANLNKTLSASYGVGDLFVTTGGGSGSNNKRYGVSNVDFGIEVTVVPEPSSIALLGLGGLTLLGRRRRK